MVVPFTLDGRQAVLVVVDMQNDFVRRSAPFYLKGCNDVIPKEKEVLQACRGVQMPAVFLKFTAGPKETLIWTWSKPIHSEEKACWKDCSRYYEDIQKEAEGHGIIEELYPLEGEATVEKYSHGGFFETNLHTVLQARNVRQTVIRIVLVYPARLGFLLDIEIHDVVRLPPRFLSSLSIMAENRFAENGSSERWAMKSRCLRKLPLPL